MQAKKRDMELLRRTGATYSVQRSTVELDGPLLAPMPRLEWSGWDTLLVRTAAGAEALASTAAALPSLRCLSVYCSASAGWEAALDAVAAVLQRYPVEELNFDVWYACEEALEIAAEATAAWLALPCATSLKWHKRVGEKEVTLGRGLAASPCLRSLEVESFGRIRTAPLLAALEGHPCLEEMKLHAREGATEEDVCMRLANMPALRSCSLLGLGKSGAHVRLEIEVESLPALEALHVDNHVLAEPGHWALHVGART